MHLKSLVQTINLGFIDRDGGIVKRDYSAFPVCIKDLANSVTLESRTEQTHFNEISEAIKKEGMYNPLIVIANSYKNWEHATNTIAPKYVEPYDGDKDYLALFGNQRIKIGLDAGYNVFDCMLVPIWQEAVVLSKRLNWGYKYDQR
tara:strand:- start:491 stop:928 length:438 start_codon:yes stop_codon:yes gene_type:complete